jgi:hypothetical protein
LVSGALLCADSEDAAAVYVEQVYEYGDFSMLGIGM